MQISSRESIIFDAKYFARIAFRFPRRDIVTREIQKKSKTKMAAFNIRRLLLLRNNLLRLLLLRRRQKRRTKYRKRFWVRRVYTERQQKGEFHLLVKELRVYDQEYFFQCFRCLQLYLKNFSLGRDTSFKNKQQKCESRSVPENDCAFVYDTW